MKLTRGGTTLIGIILFVVMVSASASPTIYIVLAAFIAFLIVNVPYAMLSVRGLSVRRDHPSHTREGTEMNVHLHVSNLTKNAKILLRFLDLGPEPGHEPLQIAMLSGGERRSVSYLCRAGRRGIYSFDSCRIESSSPFGLINSRRKVQAKSELVVYPIYYDLTGAAFPFMKTFSGLTAAPGARQGEGLSFFGLREYRSGDPIRKIHWPSTVRTRKVMVKEFEEDLHSSVSIMLDTWKRSVVEANGDTNLEMAVRVTASLANYMLINGHPTSLTYADEWTGLLRTDRAMGDLTPILDGLARANPSALNPGDLLTSCEGSASKQSNWIVVLLSPDKDALTSLLRVRSHGTEIVTVIVDGTGQAFRKSGQSWLGEMLDMFDNSGINVIMMSPGDDIQSTLSGNLRGPRRVRF